MFGTTIHEFHQVLNKKNDNWVLAFIEMEKFGYKNNLLCAFPEDVFLEKVLNPFKIGEASYKKFIFNEFQKNTYLIPTDPNEAQRANVNFDLITDSTYYKFTSCYGMLKMEERIRNSETWGKPLYFLTGDKYTPQENSILDDFTIQRNIYLDQ